MLPECRYVIGRGVIRIYRQPTNRIRPVCYRPVARLYKKKNVVHNLCNANNCAATVALQQIDRVHIH